MALQTICFALYSILILTIQSEDFPCITSKTSKSSGAGDDDKSYAYCSVGQTMTACMVRTLSATVVKLDGSYISGTTCVGVNGEGGGGVDSYAQCCTLASLQCSYVEGPKSDSSSNPSTATCTGNTTLTGCSASGGGNDIDGSWIGSTYPNTLSRNTLLDTQNTCNAFDGSPGDWPWGVKANARCCGSSSIHRTLNCKYIISSNSGTSAGNQASVSCPTGFAMTGCSGVSGVVTAKSINSWYINNNICYARNSRNGQSAIAMALCCEIVTAAPTVDPTSDPTTDPSYDPTTDPTVHPTNEPTVDPTLHPTYIPTYIPTAQPTHVPVFLTSTIASFYSTDNAAKEIDNGGFELDNILYYMIIGVVALVIVLLIVCVICCGLYKIKKKEANIIKMQSLSNVEPQSPTTQTEGPMTNTICTTTASGTTENPSPIPTFGSQQNLIEMASMSNIVPVLPVSGVNMMGNMNMNMNMNIGNMQNNMNMMNSGGMGGINNMMMMNMNMNMMGNAAMANMGEKNMEIEHDDMYNESGAAGNKFTLSDQQITKQNDSESEQDIGKMYSKPEVTTDGQ